MQHVRMDHDSTGWGGDAMICRLVSELEWGWGWKAAGLMDGGESWKGLAW